MTFVCHNSEPTQQMEQPMNTASRASKRVGPLRPLVRVCLLLGLICVSLVLASGQNPPPSVRPGYLGDAACIACHKDESASYQRTAHHLTSQTATAQGIHGLFRAGSNTLTIVDPANTDGEPGLVFRMEARGNRFFETAVTGFAPTFQQRSESIDLVTGSGKRGQTYLHWDNDRLFELPVSFWTDGQQWINSPGYHNGTADFSRPINPSCMECHSSFIQALSDDPATNRFQPSTFVPGISCETCHGAGASHVAKHAGKRANPDHTVDDTILNPAHFSRDRQLDACALCHNGIQREPLTAAFSYVPGRPLSEFFKPLPTAAADHPDVHGNQVGLLERSRCFLSSPAMTCSTCHNTHAPEQTAASYSAKCLTCHQWQSCGVAKKLGPTSASNCIDCHMPVEATTVIVSETAGKEIHATMRNHWIKIYPEAHLP